MDFASLITGTLSALAPLPCQSLPLPTTFAHVARKEMDGELNLTSQFWRVADAGELRVVHIFAPKIKVLTLFFFPYPERPLPVYCLELVVFGQQPIIGLLDALCLMPMPCAATVHAFMIQAHRHNPYLVNADDAPEWFQNCRSGDDFFIRPKRQQELEDLAAIHLELLAHQVKPLLKETGRADDPPAHRQRLHEYKRHHCVNAPGLKLMNRSFGEQWTADYMNFLFR